MELNKVTSITGSGEPRPPRSDKDRRTLDSGSTVAWYWNRLRRMSVLEVAYRVAQKLRAKVERFGLATAHQVPAADTTRPARAFIGSAGYIDTAPYVMAAAEMLAGRLAVFDRQYVFTELPEWNRDPKTGRVAPLTFGKAIDYRDERVVGDIKYLWEINRHLDLVVLAQAYRLTGEKKYLDKLQQLIESWLDQCPYLLGANWASSLELGIRLINWAIIWHLIGGLDSEVFIGNRGTVFRDRWLASIYQHMHFIQSNFSRFSSANNHLIGEAAGLYIGATTWPHWPITARWRAKARRELVREALRQNAADGVNREQAVSYQQFVLDFLLFAGLFGRANADDFPVEYWQRIERMLEFIAALMDVGGSVPMIGDADDGYVTRLSPQRGFSAYRSLLATGAAVFRRGDFKVKAGTLDDKTRWLLGKQGQSIYAELSEQTPSATLRRAFPEGGYYVLGCDFETSREIRIVADAGPLGYQSIAAHGHADALAFTLSVGGGEFLIDPGTYAYHTERWWRDYFRGTAAHNTIRVDAQDQSLIGGSFMWVRHAQTRVETWQAQPPQDRLVASHDGYTRLEDPVRHRRELVFDPAARCLSVIDTIECSGNHRLECFWHFAEDVTVRPERDGSVLAQKNGQRVRLRPDYPASFKLSVYRADIAQPAGWISRRFSRKDPTTTAVWRGEISGTTEFSMQVECAPVVQKDFAAV